MLLLHVVMVINKLYIYIGYIRLQLGQYPKSLLIPNTSALLTVTTFQSFKPYVVSYSSDLALFETRPDTSPSHTPSLFITNNA